MVILCVVFVGWRIRKLDGLASFDLWLSLNWIRDKEVFETSRCDETVWSSID